MRIQSALTLLALCELGCSPAPHAKASGAVCALKPIVPGAAAGANALSLTIDEPDDAAQPTAWQGPLHTTSAAGKSCALDATDGIFAGPFLTNGKDRLFFTSYSGSEQHARLLDVAACKTIWSSAKFGTGTLSAPTPSELRVADKTWRLGTDCVPLKR